MTFHAPCGDRSVDHYGIGKARTVSPLTSGSEKRDRQLIQVMIFPVAISLPFCSGTEYHIERQSEAFSTLVMDHLVKAAVPFFHGSCKLRVILKRITVRR